MMVNQDDVYGPCSSPSLIMKNDPLLTDLSAPDIDESFLIPFDDEDAKEWLQTEQLVNNGELWKEFGNSNFGVSNGFTNMWGLNDEVYSAGAKQTLASSCYVDDRISVPSPPLLLTAQTSHLPEKIVECNEEYPSVDCKADDCCMRSSLNTTNKQVAKHNLTSDMKAVEDKELNQFLSGKHAKRGRPMKITSRSKQALYAREYRRKNKIALWNYEKKVEEQNQEIAELMKQNEEMRKSLAEMTRQFNLMKRLVSTSPAMCRQLQEIFGNV